MTSKVLSVFMLVVLLNYVLASPVDENKPLDCPQNEEYYKCHLEKCYKKCDHLKNPPPCPSIAAGCYKRSCECIEGYFRNSEGVCVLSEQCCKYDQIPE